MRSVDLKDFPPRLPARLEGPGAWYGPRLAARGDWIATLTTVELDELAAAAEPWRARLDPRLPRLVRWSENAGDGHPNVEEGGLPVYALGLTVLRLQRLRREEAMPSGVIRAIDTSVAAVTNCTLQFRRMVSRPRLTARWVLTVPGGPRDRICSPWAIQRQVAGSLICL